VLCFISAENRVLLSDGTQALKGFSLILSADFMLQSEPS